MRNNLENIARVLKEIKHLPPFEVFVTEVNVPDAGAERAGLANAAENDDRKLKDKVKQKLNKK